MIQSKNIAIGVDMGGSHIYCAAVDLTSHTIIPDTGANYQVDNKAGSEEILTAWSQALRETLSKFERGKLAGIGFAMPGPFDYLNGVALFEKVEKFESLYGINISSELRRRLQLHDEVPFRYINDATAFAIAEAWVGKAANYVNVLALTLGTGFGSAFIHAGIPVIEGESVPRYGGVWHLPYKEGIADDYFSTRWFIKSFMERTGTKVQGVKEIADLCNTVSAARQLFEEYGRGMGSFLAPWIRRFGAEVMVLGGNITGAFHLFSNSLMSALLAENFHIDILLSDLKEDAAIMGGARLLSDEYWLRVKDLLTKM